MAIATQRPLPAQVADTFRPRGPIVRWLVVLAVAIAALLFGVLWQLAVHRHALALESLAISQATQIDGQLARLSQLPAVVAEDPRLQAVLNTRSAEHIATANALLSRVQQQTNIGQAYLMDRNGLTVAASNHATASSFVGRNYGFRQYFKHALDGNRGTQYAVGATTGEPGYFVSQPVQVASTVLGVLVFKLSLEHGRRAVAVARLVAPTTAGEHRTAQRPRAVSADRREIPRTRTGAAHLDRKLQPYGAGPYVECDQPRGQSTACQFAPESRELAAHDAKRRHLVKARRHTARKAHCPHRSEGDLGDLSPRAASRHAPYLAGCYGRQPDIRRQRRVVAAGAAESAAKRREGHSHGREPTNRNRLHHHRDTHHFLRLR